MITTFQQHVLQEQKRFPGATTEFSWLVSGITLATKMIESQTARVPSGTYLTAGIAAMIVSWLFLLGGRKNIANFLGTWVPTILIVGLYNKLVKLEGSD